ARVPLLPARAGRGPARGGPCGRARAHRVRPRAGEGGARAFAGGAGWPVWRTREALRGGVGFGWLLRVLRGSSVTRRRGVHTETRSLGSRGDAEARRRLPGRAAFDVSPSVPRPDQRS